MILNTLHTPVTVAVAGDESFSIGMAVTLLSALRHLDSGSELDARVLTTAADVSFVAHIETSLKSAGKPFTLKVIQIDPAELSDIEMTNAGLNRTVYLRLLVGAVCPDVSRAIYLDSDMIVRRDLTELFVMDMKSLSTWAVVDTEETLAQLQTELDIAEYGLDPDAGYMNAGLMLMDLDRWRRDGIARRALEIARSSEVRLRHEEQGALNVIFNGAWGRLDRRWNYMVVLNGVVPQFVPRSAFIVHTAGPCKPWMISPLGARGIVKMFYSYGLDYISLVSPVSEFAVTCRHVYGPVGLKHHLKYWLLEHHLYPTGENGRGQVRAVLRALCAGGETAARR
jgi:lipopolysaccharide biosynthesis glycosyltransferase